MSLSPIDQGSTLGQAIEDIANLPINKENVKLYLCPKATDSEIAIFLQICKHHGANPFLKDIYLIKYDDRSTASIVTSKDYFLKRAKTFPTYRGFKAGIIYNLNNEICRSNGFLPPSGILLGGWCEVFIQDRESVLVEVNLSDYNKGQAMWENIPSTMIAKVATTQAHRTAFPDNFQGLYDEDELIDQSQQKGKKVLVDAKGDSETLLPDFKKRIELAAYHSDIQDIMGDAKSKLLESDYEKLHPIAKQKYLDLKKPQPVIENTNEMSQQEIMNIAFDMQEANQ